MKHLKQALIILFVIASVACSSEKGTEEAHLGDLQHQFSISNEARINFDQGLLLLHSFEYDDAREEFEKARLADPDEVMVYWGLAMTHYKALWGLQNVDAGKRVMADLGETREERLAKAENQLETDFWTGIEILFGEGELAERNQKYVDHMEVVYRANQGNQEVAAFYALGLMWAGYDNQDYLKKSSEIAAGIIAENPTHPGALHYMIHANDDPDYAQVAINAADEYARVAPDATHALHMPSHIYVALGMWKEVVSSNEASYQASLNRVERKGLGGKERGYHSMAWLHYGYLQQGRYEEAAELLAEMISYHKDSTASREYMISMQNQQRIESGYWPDHLEPQQVDASNMGLQEKSGYHFFKSLIAFDNNDTASLSQQIEQMREEVQTASLLVTSSGIVLCSFGPTRYAPTEKGVKRAKVIIHQMQALNAMLQDDRGLTEEHLIAATKLESECGYDSGPPFIAYPSFEQYGDWLREQGRLEEALVQYDIALANRTNRSKALRGKIAVLNALDRELEAKEVEDLLQEATT